MHNIYFKCSFFLAVTYFEVSLKRWILPEFFLSSSILFSFHSHFIFVGNNNFFCFCKYHTSSERPSGLIFSDLFQYFGNLPRISSYIFLRFIMLCLSGYLYNKDLTENPNSTRAFPCEKVKINFVTFHNFVYIELLNIKEKAYSSSIMSSIPSMSNRSKIFQICFSG